MSNVSKKGDTVSCEASYISQTAVILGNVKLGMGVFVAPHATIRCDEPSSEIVIGNGCNIQDNVVIHSLAGEKVNIGENSSIGHGSIVHGPCVIGRECFVGFGSVLFDCRLGDGSMVMHRAVVEKCHIPSGVVVPSGSIVGHRDVPDLGLIRNDLARFRESVRDMNHRLTQEYLNGLDRTL